MYTTCFQYTYTMKYTHTSAHSLYTQIHALAHTHACTNIPCTPYTVNTPVCNEPVQTLVHAFTHSIIHTYSKVN